jgi:hypothetical protein
MKTDMPLKVVQIDLSNSEAIHNLFTQLDLEKLHLLIYQEKAFLNLIE